MKRLTRPLVLVAAGLTLMLGAAGVTALVIPMPSDAAAVSPGEVTLKIAASECPARINEVSRGFSVTLASLSSVAEAGSEERCAAYRAHVSALTGARDVYAACLTGFARDDQVAQLELAARDWQAVIAGRCSD
jgi:hypothetical protein